MLFPDPDLIEIQLEESFVQKIKDSLPELPQVKKERFEKAYGLTSYEAGILTEEKPWQISLKSPLSFILTPRLYQILSSLRS